MKWLINLVSEIIQFLILFSASVIDSSLLDGLLELLRDLLVSSLEGLRRGHDLLWLEHGVHGVL